MAVRFLKHVALAIPQADCDRAVAFYTAFGLQLRREGQLLFFTCPGRRYASVILIPGADRKQLHHVAMGASEAGLEAVRNNVDAAGLEIVGPVEGFADDGLWFRNPHGLLFHIQACDPEHEVAPEAPFLINSPGHYSRINAGALPPKSKIPDPVPRKLGHALLFTPNLDESIDFLRETLGMRLSDRSRDAVAFLHCLGGSDHHVLALANSSGVGLHHASFMLGTPDEVGLGGRRMVEKGYEQGWGFGRHAIGSNFFHYVRDPWGGYVEYYADIDYIGDSDSWQAQDWPLEDSLHTWGPNPPEDFVHNYEIG